MTGDRREHLRAWYREALARRAGVLEGLVPGVAEERPDAREEARQVARALGGSGGTFGFPDVGEAARVVATDRAALLPPLLGLVDVLRRVSTGGPARGRRAGRWLLYAVAPLPEPPEGGAVPPELGLAQAWDRVAARLGVDPAAVAHRVASRLHIDVADPAEAEPAARLVVPPSLALEYRVLPLRDDGDRIVAGAANPTDVLAMAALERATGRAARLDVLPPADLDVALAATYGRGGTDGPPDYGAPPVPLHRGTSPRELPSTRTVLVIDDDPGDRLLSRMALERDGAQVLEAGDAAAARQILDGDAGIDAVVLDLLMPGTDGRELLGVIRRHPVRAHVPVVVLTGLRSSENEARLMAEGADDYLRKPVEPPLLVARVHACLRRRGAATAP